MARPFITSIEDANTQLNAALDKVDAHAGLMDAAKTATTAAETRATTAENLAKTEKERADKAASDLVAANARADKAENDLKTAKTATVTGAAAPGVPPVNGATPAPADVPAKPELKGRERTAAAFASMQPAGMGRK